MSGADDAARKTAETTALVLLAAGRGTRFGGRKLAATLGERPLAHHSASVFTAFPFARRYVIGGYDTPRLEDFGFRHLALDPPGAPISQSIRIAAMAAMDAGVDAMLIALADMPLVPAIHIRDLLAAFDGDRMATRVAGTVLPPAIFGRGHFVDLTRLEGDRGAGRLLRDAPTVPLAEEDALDVDTWEDLERARVLLAERVR